MKDQASRIPGKGGEHTGINAQKTKVGSAQIGNTAQLKSFSSVYPFSEQSAGFIDSLNSTASVAQLVKISGKNHTKNEVLDLLRGDPDVVWHEEYVVYIDEIERDGREYESIHDVLLSLGSMFMARSKKAPELPDSKDDEELIEAFEEDDEEQELFFTDSMKLYRCMPDWEFNKMKQSGQLVARGGFYSPSKAYSAQYIGGVKNKGHGSYDHFVEITLNCSLWAFAEKMLNQGKAHFQNAGKAKKIFSVKNTKKGSQPYILKLEGGGTVLNIELVQDADVSDINSCIVNIVEIQS